MRTGRAPSCCSSGRCRMHADGYRRLSAAGLPSRVPLRRQPADLHGAMQVELEPGAEQQLVEEFYADIQQERRNAAAEDRAPRVERVMDDRVHVEDEEIEDEPASEAGRGRARKKHGIVREALRGDDAPSAPPPQPPAAETGAAPPLAAATVAIAAAAPPTGAARRMGAEQSRRRRKSGSTKSGPTTSPENRCRDPSRASAMLSDDHPWSVPPWKDPR